MEKSIKSKTRVSLLEDLLEEKNKEIKDLKERISFYSHSKITHTNSLWKYIDEEFLTIYSPIKTLWLFYSKSFLDKSLKGTRFDPKNVYEEFRFGWIIFTFYIFYILGKYINRNKKSSIYFNEITKESLVSF
ncbi:MAG: hypothetical protein AD073_000226 [Mycoplasmataceae bacterium]|nr:MAG: hypothetical protein AD073_000226 [Mycoplasmataceae bacterium]